MEEAATLDVSKKSTFEVRGPAAALHAVAHPWGLSGSHSYFLQGSRLLCIRKLKLMLICVSLVTCDFVIR